MGDSMDTPVITSLVMRDVQPNSRRLEQTPPWKAPFLELLALLGIIDRSRPLSKSIDQRFCFRPSQDLSEISRVFLSVSTTSSAQFDIDIRNIRLFGSDAAPPAAEKLQEYANHVLQQIRVFRDRLLERGVIEDSTCFLRADLFTCPVCQGELISCFDCNSKLACFNSTCLGSLVVDCEVCYDHSHKRMTCHACLAKNNSFPSLVHCPMCQDWFCREDADWCAGLVLNPALGTKELVELSRKCDWDNTTIVRSHPPKPGPCRSCTDYDMAPGWARCSNTTKEVEPDRCPCQTALMTALRLLAVHCADCVEHARGHACACQRTWICGVCAEIGNKTAYFPILITCPRCGVKYCHGPEDEYTCGDTIDTCRGCKGASLCRNCEEEEELPGDVRTDLDLPNRVVFIIRCNFCEAWSCADCHASERTATCFLCDEWYCYGCISDPECSPVIERCPFCNGNICRYCRTDHQACPGARMLNNVLPPPYLDTF